MSAQNLLKNLLKWTRASVLFILLALGFARHAAANLIQDADFSQVSYSGTTLGVSTPYFGQFGGVTPTLTVADWTSAGYNFVYTPGSADSGYKATGANAGQPNEAPGEYAGSNGYGNTYMYGLNNGGVDSIPSSSPAGGNFIAGDGAFQTGAISQSIGGLTVGQTYVLKFYWAGAQQQSFTGPTTASWTVSLGSQAFTTGSVSVVSKGFSGWMQDTMYFTATNATETLSFLSVGTPSGQPPFALLGGVDLEVVPDFSNWMVFTGFGGACVTLETFRRRRRRGKSE